MAQITITDFGGRYFNRYQDPIVETFYGTLGVVSATSTTINLIGSKQSYYGYGDGNVIDVEVTGTFGFGLLNTVSGIATAVSARIGTDMMFEITDLDIDAGRVTAALTSSASTSSVLLAGDDVLIGGGDHRIYFDAHGGNDTLTGGTNRDNLSGGAGGDELNGGAGNDTLWGNRGNDLLNGGDGDDSLSGGNGIDSLFGDAGEDSLDGDKGNDRLHGGLGDDRLSGGGQNDVLIGGKGHDDLRGDDDDDQLYGGGGRDALNGGSGNDILTGGTGKDQFIFAGFGDDRRGSGEDVIADWEIGERIRLNGVDRNEDATATQVGDDVVITLNDNQVTVLDALLADVEASIKESSYYYYGY